MRRPSPSRPVGRRAPAVILVLPRGVWVVLGAVAAGGVIATATARSSPITSAPRRVDALAQGGDQAGSCLKARCVWRTDFFGDLPPQAGDASARARPRAHHRADSRAPPRRIPDGHGVCSTRKTASSGRICARKRCSVSTLHMDHGCAAGSISFGQPEFVRYLDAGDLRRCGAGPNSASRRGRHARDPDRALRRRGKNCSFARDVTRSRRGAHAPADFIATYRMSSKTPLTVISGFVETAAGADLDERQRTRFPLAHARAGGEHAAGWWRTCLRCPRSRASTTP